MNESDLSKGVYFFTLKLLGRFISNDFELFEKKDFCDEIIKALIYFIENRGLKLFGFVLLSNQLHLIIEAGKYPLLKEVNAFKKYSSNEIFVAIGKKLASSNYKDNRDEKELRRTFNMLLNTNNNCLWKEDDTFIKLPIRSNLTDITQIEKDELLIHLTDCKKNYRQLGAYAFTKVMMKSMSI